MWLTNLVSQMDPGGTKRRRTIFFSFPVCCLVLFLVFDVGSSSRIEESTVTVTTFAEDGPQYKDLNVTGNYTSNPNFDPDGFEWLYTITKSFMDSILDDAIPKDVITISTDNDINFDLTNHVSDIFKQYACFVVVCLIIVIFALVMLISGFCFTCYCCCCNCCCKSTSINTTKNGIGKKITLITLLIICGAFITFGAVCVLNANLRLRDGIQELPGDMQNSIDDARTFLDVTGQQIDIILSYNFKQFIDWVSNELDTSLIRVQNEINLIGDEINKTNIFDIAASFGDMKKDETYLSNFTTNLEDVKSSLSKIKTDLNEAIVFCGTFEEINCTELQDSINKFDFVVDVTLVNDPISNLNNIFDITDGIEECQQKFDNIKTEVGKKILDGRDEAKSSIQEAANTMKSSADQISVEIKKLETYFPKSNSRDSKDRTFVDDAQDFVDNYSSYIYYFGLFISCLLFSIACLLAVGMVLGFFKISVLNKTGRVLLLCGTTIMFYFTIILAVVTLVYFMIGMISQQAVCKSLRDPSNSTFFKLVDQYDLSKSGLDIKVSQILISIHSNKSVYNVLDLKKQFDLDKLNDYLGKFKIQLDKFVDVVNGFNFSEFQILTEEQKKNFNNLSDPQLSIVSIVETFMQKLPEKISDVNSKKLIEALKKQIDDIRNKNDDKYKELQDKLITSQDTLQTQDDVMDELEKDIPNVKIKLADLKVKLNLGGSSFDVGRDTLLSNINKVEKRFKDDSPAIFKTILQELSDETFKVCQNYINLVGHNIENDVGQVGPLGVIYDATLTSVCDKVTLQMNSFWFVLLWTMLLFLPTAIISAILANVYKSEKPLKGGNGRVARVRKPPTKANKSKKDGENDVTRAELNRNPYMFSHNVDDITLDKWEQYPPSELSSRNREEYRTPPPYFFTENGGVDDSPKFHDIAFDNLNRWVQYPSSGSTRF